jgi:hypothetical protein
MTKVDKLYNNISYDNLNNIPTIKLKLLYNNLENIVSFERQLTDILLSLPNDSKFSNNINANDMKLV